MSERMEDGVMRNVLYIVVINVGDLFVVCFKVGLGEDGGVSLDFVGGLFFFFFIEFFCFLLCFLIVVGFLIVGVILLFKNFILEGFNFFLLNILLIFIL